MEQFLVCGSVYGWLNGVVVRWRSQCLGSLDGLSMDTEMAHSRRKCKGEGYWKPGAKVLNQ